MNSGGVLKRYLPFVDWFEIAVILESSANIPPSIVGVVWLSAPGATPRVGVPAVVTGSLLLFLFEFAVPFLPLPPFFPPI